MAFSLTRSGSPLGSPNLAKSVHICSIVSLNRIILELGQKQESDKKNFSILDVRSKMHQFCFTNSSNNAHMSFAEKVNMQMAKSLSRKVYNKHRTQRHLIRACSSENEVSTKASLEEENILQKGQDSTKCHRKKHGSSSAAVTPKSFPPKT